MTVKRHLTLALLLSLTVLGGSGLILLTASAAAAGQTTTTEAPTTDQSNQTGGEVITDSLTLVSKSYEADERGNGTLSLTFRADGPQAVTLYDAGAFMTGGQLPSRTQVIEGTVTVEMPVTRPEGSEYVGVTVVSGGTRYSVPHQVEPDSTLFTGRPTWQDTQIAGLSGFLGGLLVITAVAWRRVTSDKGEVERVL
ncbi:hypothetical protein [Halorientalis halophila]|uniref:hypothetical protein n=1 Tax=Halorientalis halophila TaxID=3108499 RepID=UPI003009F9B5